MTASGARPWAALLLGTTLAAAGTAQTAPDEPNQPLPVPGQVLSDVELLPAEDRDSQGAVVLQYSRVRAMRKVDAFTAAGERTGVPSVIGRNVSRVLERARTGQNSEAEAQPEEPAQPSPLPPDPALR